MMADAPALKAKRFVAFPAPAAAIATQYSSDAVHWLPGNYFTSLNTWEVVATGLSAGRYYVRVAWCTDAPDHYRLTDWSVRKYDDLA